MAAAPLGRSALEALGITPDTRLGQHFLVDRNIVDVALRLADLDPEDVAVEVGPGAGVLTSALADPHPRRPRDRARPAARGASPARARRPR